MNIKQKTAIISGITGQDGSYLAELLLSKGYKVIGIKRRTSLLNAHERLDSFYNNENLQLVYGNMHDASSIFSIINKYKPDEFYNLAAQSHVKVSFEVTEETLDTVAKSTLRILNAIKELSPHTRFYQASSSEMYGTALCPSTGYTEDSIMLPASPYAAAKLFGHNIVKNYRNSYGLHASSGILFNHECVEYNTPIIIKNSNGNISICRPVDLIPLKRKGTNVQTYEIYGTHIWDGTSWTKLKAITTTKRNFKNKEQEIRLIQTRGGVISATNHHKMLDENMNEIRCDEIKLNDKLAHGKYPTFFAQTHVTKDLAFLLGILAADGYVSKNGCSIRVINNDQELLHKVKVCWEKTFLGTTSIQNSVSGFKPENSVSYISLNGVPGIGIWLRSELHNSDHFKKVPDLILNSDLESIKEFLAGYYSGDGLKAGSGLSFKTNSSVLAQGLLYLYSLMNKTHTIYVEEKNSAMYYFCNLSGKNINKGQHLVKDKLEVRKISENIIADDWVFDLETESGIFNAGVGTTIIHNSPRRGETFVSRKISIAAARIKTGVQGKLHLGNLDACRDWGHAEDYVYGMYLMLQQEKPDDYVLATGETHTVREFLEETFKLANLDIDKHVEIDSRLFRPEEVPYLLGDASKANKTIGWLPKIKFKELVQVMYEHEIENILK